MSDQREAALFIERLTVRSDRVVCDVAVAPSAPRSTSPALIAHVLKEFPTLSQHACVNDQGDTFAAVMERTSLPHLLEHLVIDLQVQAHVAAPTAPNCPAPVFVGTTEWTDEFAGRARIEVSFTDDLVALRAFRDATSFLNRTVVP